MKNIYQLDFGKDSETVPLQHEFNSEYVMNWLIVRRVVRFLPPGIYQWEKPGIYRVFPGREKQTLQVLDGKKWEIAKK